MRRELGSRPDSGLARGVLVAALLSAACEPGSDMLPLTTTRFDSAGVSIVVSADSEREFRLSQPLVIYGSERDPIFALTGALLLDSLVVIGDHAEYRLRAMSPDGSVVWTFGRFGEGPGEFGSLILLQRLSPDRLAVADIRHRRVTVLSRDGELIEIVRPEFGTDTVVGPDPVVVPSGLFGLLPDGRVLGTPVTFWHLDGVPGPVSYDVVLSLWDPSQDAARPIRRMKAGTWYETDDPQFAPAFKPRHAPAFQFGASGVRTVVTSAETHRMLVFDDGALSMEIREARPRRPMPDAIRDETRFEQPDSLPAYTDLTVDGESRVWVASPVDSSGARQWRVFGPDGVPEGYLVLPESDAVLDALDTRVLIHVTDSLGVETVRLHHLVESGENGA